MEPYNLTIRLLFCPVLDRSEGMVTYRLKTSTGRLIFLRSRGFIQYDENTKEIISFFCINSLIEYVCCDIVVDCYGAYY